MNRQINISSYLLILAAISFWVSWFLMPNPGTTNTQYILSGVKQSRTEVLFSVIIQIIASVLYMIALFILAARTYPQKKITITGAILFGIGILGLCTDAFFHLLAYFMTDNSVHIQEDVVQTMTFMQTTGVAFLVPLLLPFFIGSIVLAIGLNKQGFISKLPATISLSSIGIGIAGTLAANIFEYHGAALQLVTLAVFAFGQILVGLETLPSKKGNVREHSWPKMMDAY